jgi:hypothetical protein
LLIRMKLRVDISHLQCMYFPGETAKAFVSIQVDVTHVDDFLFICL